MRRTLTIPRLSLSLPLAALAIGSIAVAAPAGGPLTLDAFLNQVRTGNQAVQSRLKAAEGGALRAEEGDTTVFAPRLFADATWQRQDNDAIDPLSPFAAIQNDFNLYNLGVEKAFSFGATARLSYRLLEVDQTFPSTLPPEIRILQDFYQTGPTFEVSVPLWRNFGGREFRAQSEQLNAAAGAARHANAFAATQLLTGAEAAYYRLAVARELVRETRGNVERAQKIVAWSQRRGSLQLADRSDVLQAEAALQARQLELQGALDEEHAAARAFNDARGVSSDEVKESLLPLDDERLQQAVLPDRAARRQDVLAAEAQQKAAAATARLGRERNQPVVEAFARANLLGQDPLRGPAVNEGFSTNWPTTTFGVRLNMPLDLGGLSDNRRGYVLETEAADLSLQRTQFENERLWNNLTQQLRDAQNRLKLARALERTQAEKVSRERDRQQVGRTTTFQVIQFEQDLANAQIQRIRTQVEIVNLLAQLKTFGVQP